MYTESEIVSLCTFRIERKAVPNQGGKNQKFRWYTAGEEGEGTEAASAHRPARVDMAKTATRAGSWGQTVASTLRIPRKQAPGRLVAGCRAASCPAAGRRAACRLAAGRLSAGRRATGRHLVRCRTANLRAVA